MEELMKKKFIIFVLIIFSVQYLFSEVNMKIYRETREKIIESKPKIEESYQYLHTTSKIGYDYNDIYLGFILKDSNAEALLKKLFKEAQHNAGKISALIGLNYLNSSNYNSLKKELKGNVLIYEKCYNLSQNAQEYMNNYERQFDRGAFEIFINQLP